MPGVVDHVIHGTTVMAVLAIMVVIDLISINLVPRPASMLLVLRGTGRTPGVVDQVIHGTTVTMQSIPHLLTLYEHFTDQ